jgi:hypothetical protein
MRAQEYKAMCVEIPYTRDYKLQTIDKRIRTEVLSRA